MTNTVYTVPADTSQEAIERVIGWNEVMASTYEEGSAGHKAHTTTAAVVRALALSATARERQLADLLAASRELDTMYGHIWDRVDGCLVLFPSAIERFENARSAVVDAMEKANG